MKCYASVIYYSFASYYYYSTISSEIFRFFRFLYDKIFIFLIVFKRFFNNSFSVQLGIKTDELLCKIFPSSYVRNFSRFSMKFIMSFG